MLFASLWRSSTKIGMWFTPYISVLLDVHGDYIIKGNRSIFDLPSFFGNLLKHILVFVDMKQFFAQHQIVFVDNRSLFVQRQFFFWHKIVFCALPIFCFGHCLEYFYCHVVTKIESRAKRKETIFIGHKFFFIFNF